MTQITKILDGNMPPNGWRYATSEVLVGGTRQRHFDGTSLKSRKRLENAQSPITVVPAISAGDRVHDVLDALLERQPRELKQAATAELTKSTTYQNTGQAKARANGKTDLANE